MHTFARYFRIGATSLLLAIAGGQAIAEDVITVDRPQSVTDKRNDYAYLLLIEVLERTKAEFGPYRVEQAPAYMERDRLLREMQSGQIVNLTAQPSQPSWDRALLPIAVPLDMGLQSWRIALIHQRNTERLRALRSLEDLKVLSAGVGSGWATLAILQSNNFNIVTGSSYDGLFGMLMSQRFDYFLRGVNEIWPEFDDRKGRNPDLSVDESFILNVPLPWLFFVSPNSPRIAKRVTRGMEDMVSSGALKKFVLTHHKANIERAKVCQRRVFVAPNTLMTIPALKRPELWLDILDPKTGFCT